MLFTEELGHGQGRPPPCPTEDTERQAVGLATLGGPDCLKSQDFHSIPSKRSLLPRLSLGCEEGGRALWLPCGGPCLWKGDLGEGGDPTAHTVLTWGSAVLPAPPHLTGVLKSKEAGNLSSSSTHLHLSLQTPSPVSCLLLVPGALPNVTHSWSPTELSTGPGCLPP